MSTPSNNKKRRRSEDEEEEGEKVAMAANGTPPPAPPGVSPPGTKLRSGRKVKPRRSLEDHMDRAKRIKLGEDDASESEEDFDMDQDEGMDDQIVTHDDHEEEQQAQKVPATTNSASASDAADTTSESLSQTAKMSVAAARPVNLRLPSQHTPGRVMRPTEPPAAARPVAAPAPAFTARTEWKTDNTKIAPPPPPQQRMNFIKTPHKPSDMAVASPSPSMEQKKLFDGTSPSKQQPVVVATSNEDGAPEAADHEDMPSPLPPWLDHTLSQPWACFFVLLALMGMPPFLIVNPFFDGAVNASKSLVPFYQSFLGSSKKAEQSPEVAKVPAPPPVKVLSNETNELIAESEQLNQTLTERQKKQESIWQELVQTQQLLDGTSGSVETLLEALQVRQTELQAKLQTTLAGWQEQSEELKRIAALSTQVLVPDREDPDGFVALQSLLSDEDAMALVNTRNLLLWDPQLETCDIPTLESILQEDSEQTNDDKEEDEQPVVVTRELVMEYWGELREELDEEFEAIQKDSEWRNDIMKWIQDYADATPLPEYEVPEIPELHKVASRSSTSRSKHGPNGDTIRRVVDARLEVDRADGTGRTDYAALFQGASVVRTGPRATSPSLADSLPLLNRLMAVMGVQFYGYGPEAALTPSYPADSLGQCWAFVEEEPVNKFGGYAVLTVQLAKPILVQSISIEHPPPEVARKSRSAIRKFRVFGYVDPDAASDPVALGSFLFEVNSKQRKVREEFELEGDYDEDIPRLAAISLVIDSTWGPDYACLYRFRVHGRE